MITGVRWFSGRTVIGIVQVVQEHQKEQYRQTGEADFKYYIGNSGGRSEQTDMEGIAEWGTHFDTRVGDFMFGVER